MTPDDFETIAPLIEGWCFGIMTAILYSLISDNRAIRHRNRRHQELLDAGVDPVTILAMDERY